VAIDTRIPLNINIPKVSDSQFTGALQHIQEAPLRRAQLQAQEALVPVQQQAAMDKASVLGDQAASSKMKRQLTNIARVAMGIGPAIKSGDKQAVMSGLVREKFQLDALGEDTTFIDEAIELANQEGGIAALGQEVGNAIQTAQNFGAISDPMARNVATKSYAPVIDSKTGQISIPTFDANTNVAALVPIEGAVAETPEAKLKRETEADIRLAEKKGKISGRTSAVNAAVSKGSKIFDQIKPLSTAITNYDEAIAAIDSGAETGVVASMLPSFRKSSIELDNVVKRLGLDVVGNTTFGALSESELKFALKAAIPDSLQPEDLKQWLTAKKRAQQKVLERVQEAASFLSSGTNTIKDWIEFDAAKQLNAGAAKELGPLEVQQPAPAANIGRFTVQEVN